jgi:hypothetical protein
MSTVEFDRTLMFERALFGAFPAFAEDEVSRDGLTIKLTRR